MRWNSQQHAQAAHAQTLGPAPHPIRRLPFFYIKAITRPSARTFARAAEYASWKLVWIQLAVLLLIPVVMGLLRSLFRDTSTGVDTHSNLIFGLLSVITVGATIGAFILKVIFVPLLFLIEVSLQYLVARFFKGNGHYVGHAFSMLLYLVPLSFIGGVIITLFVAFHFSTLFFAPLITLLVFCYGVVINVFVVRGVHNIDRDKAIIAVAVPYIIGILAVFGLVIALAHYLSSSLPGLH
ncbi:YIP1 family protein [Dictyobacter kobayashii]|uniref:Yip1 domain-containing protein n=1 Tax=Dictyobacter kobayashii TaxID=2014872 RepID=A0A402AJC4_9CHLR|nr:YIP1 family protein [Dictyobacter kobayashii]GCE19189.1 hypothetical protein KDK_29890 [Dictyobacter kobayashii]